MRWRECHLFDLGEVVLGILIENQLAYRSERVLLVWPNLGQIEDRVLELLGLFDRHRLDVKCPGGVLAALDSLEQVLGRPVRVFTCNFDRLLLGEELRWLIALVVELSVDEVTLIIDELVRVSGVSVHEAALIQYASVQWQRSSGER